MLTPPSLYTLPFWRRVEVVGLMATIPAFYMELMSVYRPLAVTLYLVGFLGSALVVWHDRSRLTHEASWRAAISHHGLGLLLMVALALSASLPAGDGALVLGLRLCTATLIVFRLADSLRHWFLRGSLPHLMALTLGVLFLCGAGFWWLEPKAASFGDGLWLAFTTAATVGYGDIVPSTPAAKIFAVFVVLMGFAVLSLVTAAIAAMWVQSEERRIEHEILHDLRRQMHSLHEELAAIRRAQAHAASSAAGQAVSESERQPM